MKKLMFIVLLLMVLSPVEAADITACQHINSTGTYTLTQNVNASATCFTVQAASVTIDCQGYAINYSQSSAGYAVSATSYDGATVRNCNIVQGSASNSAYGIYMSSSNSPIIHNNTIATRGGSSHGIYIATGGDGYGYEAVTNNTITASGSGYGIYIQNYGSGNVTGNTIRTLGGGYGFYLIGLYAASNRIFNNFINSSSTSVFLTSGAGTNFFNTTLSNGTNIAGGSLIGGNYYTTPNATGFSQISSTCTDGNSDGICDSSLTHDANNIDFLPLTTGQGNLTCGELTASGTYTLTQNVNASATCFTVQAASVAINCSGYTINYSQSAAGSAVSATSYDGVTVRDCNIVQGSALSSAYGIYTSNLNFALIRNNTITTRGGSSYGIYLFSGTTGYGYMNVSNNTITTSGSSGHGIYDQNFGYGSIMGNTIKTLGGGNGFYLVGIAADGNRIYNNFINSSAASVFLSSAGTNFFNTTLSNGTNIVGGSLLGGNFYANSTHNGFSQNCTDGDSDGICDGNLTHDASNIDFLPLAIPPLIVTFQVPTPNNETISITWAYINVSTNVAPGSVTLEWNGANESMSSATSLSWFVNKTLASGNYTFRVYATGARTGVSETRWVQMSSQTSTAGSFYTLAKNVMLNLAFMIGISKGDDVLSIGENYVLAQDGVTLGIISAGGKLGAQYDKGYSPAENIIRINQATEGNRFLLVFTNGTNQTIINRLGLLKSGEMPSRTFGSFMTAAPSGIFLFLRLVYEDADITTRTRWGASPIQLLVRNTGTDVLPQISIETVK